MRLPSSPSPRPRIVEFSCPRMPNRVVPEPKTPRMELSYRWPQRGRGSATCLHGERCRASLSGTREGRCVHSQRVHRGNPFLIQSVCSVTSRCGNGCRSIRVRSIVKESSIMAPKSKGGKKGGTKSPKREMPSGVDMEAASIEELNQKISTLEKEKNKEEEYRNYMQLERVDRYQPIAKWRRFGGCRTRSMRFGRSRKRIWMTRERN